MSTKFAGVFLSQIRPFRRTSDMANIIKDIGEIWTRLFDHRPFLNGEIRFFLQEFEEKRADREVDRLFEILQNFTEIRYTQIDKIKQEGETNLLALKQKLDENCKLCDSILEKEGKYTSDINLTTNKEARKTKLNSVVKDIQEKCQQVDKVFDEEERKLYKCYSDLDQQLHTSTGL